MSQTFPFVNRTLFVAVLFLIVSLTGCAGISLNRIVSVETSGPADYLSHQTGQGYVQVYREGQRLDTRRGMVLKPGDEIQTGPDGSAAIRFMEHGTVVLDPNTRVRVGSLEVIVGKIFADVRGLFSVFDEEVILGVEGTRFMFEGGANRATRAVVLEGVVRVSSKQDKWVPVRVLKGSEFRSTLLNEAGAPRIVQANRGELDEIARKVEQITDAPERGFCCLNGNVNRSLSNSCAGKFYTSHNSAVQGCQKGWCCQNQKVSSGLYYQCHGKFYTDQERAINACKPPPEPIGWCCVNGSRLVKSTRRECHGTFYKNSKRAKRECKIPDVE